MWVRVPSRLPLYIRVAQLEEQQTTNLKVWWFDPTRGYHLCLRSMTDTCTEFLPREIGGSNPSGDTNITR